MSQFEHKNDNMLMYNKNYPFTLKESAIRHFFIVQVSMHTRNTETLFGNRRRYVLVVIGNSCSALDFESAQHLRDIGSCKIPWFYGEFIGNLKNLRLRGKG